MKQPVRFAVLGGLAALLAGCGAFRVLDTRTNTGPCPLSTVLYDAARLVEVGEVERHEYVGFTGSVEGVKGFCRYVKTQPIDMELEIDFAFGRGPQAASDEKTYVYWVAVTRRDRLVLAKERFPVVVKFRPGETVVRRREKVDGISIPRASETVAGTNFEVLVGFELTPEQLAFNRAGKRFRLQVQ